MAHALPDRRPCARQDHLARAAEASRPMLLAAADRILRDASEAEDAVQDALVCALRSLDRFRGDAQLSSWLYRITVNCALMRLRRRVRRRSSSLEAECAKGLPDLAQLPADELLAARRSLAELDAAFATLSGPQRQVLLLRGVHEVPVADVARRVGRSRDAVKMLTHRARERLRAQLAPA